MHKGVALGTVLDVTTGRPVPAFEADLDLLSKAGAQVVRFEFLLGRGPLADWRNAALQTVYRDVVRKLQQEHRTLIGLLSDRIVAPHLVRTPNGAQARNNAERFRGDEATFQQFLGAYVDAVRVITEMGLGIRLWEIWNEPNAVDTMIRPERYAQVLDQTHAAVQGTLLPGSRIITGGLLDTVSAPDMRGADYLRALLRALAARRPFDAIGQHLYVDQGTAQLTVDPAHLQEVLTALHTVLHEEDQATRPVFITEAGWQNQVVGRVSHATNLTTLFNVCHQAGTIEMLCWFTLRDAPGQTFGLFDQDGQERPALASFQAE
jgi:hypothetical protein